MAPFDEFARVRNKLAKAITADVLFVAGAPAEDPIDFAPYRRQYLVHQRAMDAGIGPLRSQMRAALAGKSAALGRLAALDAVLDEALLARERHLLSKVPLLLEKRFEHLRKLQPVSANKPNSPNPVPPPAGWLAQYRQDIKGVLLAELDIRLQPVEGLMAALGPETTRQQ